MKYLLAEKSDSPISYDTQLSAGGESSHKYILDEIRNRINAPSNERRISERIKNLKQSRILADYTDRTFSQDESLECLDEANGIIKNLKNLFSA